ncbi:Malonate--CoA ligase ACSF3-like [Homarus americanus]|uniref:Malonate--CoA ligase ACSF3-like n=1 Tax=Homarus americanus TaxID=6706 RepID=A0A8J5TLJ6_HOMAM|nr:Malonate--CoA ligase ACSF3-like [Homarus americanus]
MLRIATRGVQLFRSPQTFSTQWQYISKHWVYTSSTSGTSVLPVFRKALQYQDNVALTDEHGEHTYGHIHKLSGHLAWLMQNVLGEDSVQQRIAFLCPNDVSYVITQWATWMAGHIGVVLSHKNVLSQMSCLRQAWGWTSGDAILHCLPLHHVHGIINALLCPLYVGARVVMLPQFSAPAVWSQLLSLDTPVHSRVNLFMAVPTMYVKLIEEHKNKLIKNARMQEYVKSVCTQNIRLMVSGSAALPEPIFEQWQQITGHTLLERYGMTEIGMALSNPLKGTRKPGFVGSPLPGVEVCIAKFVPGNDKYESGELLVRGPNVFKEYWKNSQATLKEFTQDGWFKTGDTAQYTDGAYKILGRTSVDIIKSGGFKISALDVERHLLAHPNIVDVAVVGIPDITWGQKVAAVVEVSGDENLDPLELRKWGQERMPHYQVPSVIVSVTNPLPRNNMGKVNKKNILKEFFPETASVP